jgi:rifampin ADP-ribosylating transferase
MLFDPSNNIVKLCTQGMVLESKYELEQAHNVFQQAWDSAASDFERFTAAHYLARNQKDPLERLKWNIDALEYSEKIQDEEIVIVYPSLYLNVAKSYEDLNNLFEATKYYHLASDNCKYLKDDAYGQMIKSGVKNGLERVAL